LGLRSQLCASDWFDESFSAQWWIAPQQQLIWGASSGFAIHRDLPRLIFREQLDR
jgi:hypothetical protein